VVTTIRPTRGYRVFQAVNAVVLTAVVLITLFPFVNIVARSFSGERQIRTGQISVFPRGFNVTTYQHVMSDAMLQNREVGGPRH
jgi:putative aldouronate transport system permease protein